MSEETRIHDSEAAEPVEETKKSKSKSDAKNVERKPNFFVRAWKKICKFAKDVAGEMKKVVWTPLDELNKSTKIVLAAVVAIGIAIAIVDTSFSWVINSIAGMIG